MIRLKSGEENINLECNKIIFFEKMEEKRKILVHGIDKEVIVSGTLKDVEEKLGKDFYKCYKNFLININHVVDIDKENKIVKMNNKKECIVGERHINKLIRILNTNKE